MAKGEDRVNRRQKKKQFKKKYGMNPKQYEIYMQQRFVEMLKSGEIFRIIEKGLKDLGEVLKTAAGFMEEMLTEFSKRMQDAAVLLETEELLRKSYILPEGTDKENLKDMGIRPDRLGGIYHFYHDEANDAYFIEIMQEGGAEDGNDDANSEDVRHGMPDCIGPADTDYANSLPGSSDKELD